MMNAIKLSKYVLFSILISVSCHIASYSNGIEALRMFPFGMEFKEVKQYLDTNKSIVFDKTLLPKSTTSSRDVPFVKQYVQMFEIPQIIIDKDTLLDVEFNFIYNKLSTIDYHLQFDSDIKDVLKRASYYLGKSKIKKEVYGTAYGAKATLTHHNWDIHDKSITLSVSDLGDFPHKVKFEYLPNKQVSSELQSMVVSLGIETTDYSSKPKNSFQYDHNTKDTLTINCESVSEITLSGKAKGLEMTVECSNGKLLRMVRNIDIDEKKMFRDKYDFTTYCESVLYDKVDDIEYYSTRFNVYIKKDNIILFHIPVKIDHCSDYE